MFQGSILGYPLNSLIIENDGIKKLKAMLSSWIQYVQTKQKKGPSQDANELFTPEQRKHLESLGYL